MLVSPEKAVESFEARGVIDGGIARLLAGRLWRKLVAVREAEEADGISTRALPQHQSLLAELASGISAGVNDSAAWLNELLLSLLYRRHLTAKELLRMLPHSLWWHKFQPQGNQIDGRTQDGLFAGSLGRTEGYFRATTYV